MAYSCILRAAEVVLFFSFAAMLVTFTAPNWMEVSFRIVLDRYTGTTGRMTQKYGLWYMSTCVQANWYSDSDECRTVSYHEIRESIWMYDEYLSRYYDKFDICFTSSYSSIRDWEIQVTIALALVMLSFYLTRKQRIRNADMLAGKSNVPPSNACLKFTVFCGLVQDVLMGIQIRWFVLRNHAAVAIYGRGTITELPVCVVAAVVAIALSLMAALFLMIAVHESPPRQSTIAKQQVPLVTLQSPQQAPPPYGSDQV